VVNVTGPAGEVDTNTVVKMREYGGLTPGGTAIEVLHPLPPPTHLEADLLTSFGLCVCVCVCVALR
jgi:hypothetical protein